MVIASMDEASIVLNFMCQLVAWESDQDIAAKGAESRLQSLEALELNRRHQAGILATLDHVRAAAEMLRQSNQESRMTSAELALSLDQMLVNAFVHMGLSEHQERQVTDLVTGFMQQQRTLLDRSEETDRVLRDLSERLGQLAPG